MNPARLLSGLVFAVICAFAAQAGGLPRDIVLTIAITALTGFWWMSEAMPIPATSLVPFALFPMAGILDQREAAAALGGYVIILLMASFMLSKALERCGVHERLALYMIKLVGVSGRRLVLGFMFAAGLLSMWISNAATTLALSTMALAILARSDNARLGPALLLGIAYASSLGGTATLVGTPPNLIFADNYFRTTGEEFSFTRWMAVGLPVAAVGVPVMGLWLTRSLKGVNAPELPDMGAWRVR
ncbi:MAG: SLC13 family permease [Parvularculaceae bacterium]